MNWKIELSKLEESKNWNSSISLLDDLINKNDEDSLHAYLYLIYLLMNLLVEENYESENHNYYSNLIKKYFDESYIKYSNSSEYLFFIGIIASIAEWYLELEMEEVHLFLQRAANMEPNNILYKWGKLSSLDMREKNNKIIVIKYAKNALLNDNVKKELESKGSLGRYFYNTLKFWAEFQL